LHLANHALEDTKKNPPNNFLFLFFLGTNGNCHCKAKKKATRGQYPCVSRMEVQGIKVTRVTVSTKITHFGHRKTPHNLFVVSIT